MRLILLSMSSQINDTKIAHNVTEESQKPSLCALVHFRIVKSGITAKALLKSLVWWHSGFCYPYKQGKKKKKETSNELSKILAFHDTNSLFFSSETIEHMDVIQDKLYYTVPSLFSFFLMGYTMFATKNCMMVCLNKLAKL